nr:MAG TPA: hypothetical protein [Caudoviricetes sp.]
MAYGKLNITPYYSYHTKMRRASGRLFAFFTSNLVS